MKFPDETFKEMEAEKALEEQLMAKHLKRRNAAKLGWMRKMLG
jgi:hypothetical protein